MTIAAIVISGIIFSLLKKPASRQAARRDLPSVQTPAEVSVQHGRVVISSNSPMMRRLEIRELNPETVSHPLVTVTGSVVARIRSGDAPLEDRWQFVTSELSTTYASWLKAGAEVEFATQSLKKTTELASAQEAFCESIVARLTSVTEGGVSLKEIAAAKADLVRAQLQGQKDIFTEESNLRVARQARASYERELAQLGLEPEVLQQPREGMVLISAQAPEGKISLIHEQQACQARFYGFPNKDFSAHVEHLGAILNTQRRTLRVLFDLTDEQEQLRPGMFADVRLGTETRQVIMIPNDAVIHLGQWDYALRQESADRFLPVRVEVSEPIGEFSEVHSGISPRDRIVCRGAILLKPLAMRAINP